jgi:AcrR family transcriptional regulator
MPVKLHVNKSLPNPRGAAHARLTSALAALMNEAPKRTRLTVAELCRRAGVSRNSLYRYHAPILEALRQNQRRPGHGRAEARRAAERRRREELELHERFAKLAGLVDHYFTAYRETAALLERRERELAELRGKLASRPTVVPLPSSVRNPP